MSNLHMDRMQPFTQVSTNERAVAALAVAHNAAVAFSQDDEPLEQYLSLMETVWQRLNDMGAVTGTLPTIGERITGLEGILYPMADSNRK